MAPAPKLRKLVPDKDGYLCVMFMLNGKCVLRKVHHLVLEAFRGPRAANQETRHHDNDVANNALANLSWDTHEVNVQDKVRHGTTLHGERNHRAKLTTKQVVQIHHRLANGERGCDLAVAFGVAGSVISRIKKGTRWPHVKPAQKKR